jgi:glycolate oxidase FAD binding subunit
MERIAGIQHFEPADLTLTAAAGTRVAEIEEALAPHGQWLPFDPPFAPRRSLGGLVASGARGPLSAAYGAPRDHVLGVTVVTGDGRVLELGGRVMKNVAGFDMVKLWVGSRGTLGVVVSATVRVFPTPEVDRALVLADRPVDELVRVGRLVATAPVAPVRGREVPRS